MAVDRDPGSFDYATRVEADYQTDRRYWQREDRLRDHEPAPEATVRPEPRKDHRGSGGFPVEPSPEPLVTPPFARAQLAGSVTVLRGLALQAELAGEQGRADVLKATADQVKLGLEVWNREARVA